MSRLAAELQRTPKPRRTVSLKIRQKRPDLNRLL